MRHEIHCAARGAIQRADSSGTTRVCTTGGRGSPGRHRVLHPGGDLAQVLQERSSERAVEPCLEHGDTDRERRRVGAEARDRYGQTDDARGGLLVVDGVPALTGRRQVRQQGGHGREGALAEGGQGVTAQPVLDQRGVECRQERLAGGGTARRNPATGPPWTGRTTQFPPACARGRTSTRRGLGQPKGARGFTDRQRASVRRRRGVEHRHRSRHRGHHAPRIACAHHTHVSDVQHTGLVSL